MEIRDNGDVQKINILSIYGLIMTDTGYFLCGNSENEYGIKDINDFFSIEIDSIFFYDFNGEIKERFYLDGEEYSKEGYKLETVIYMDNEMLIIYLNDCGNLKIENLYIGDRIQI